MSNPVEGPGVIGGVGAGGAALSAGASSQNSGTITFSNSNGISFGLNAGVLTATVTPGAAAGIAAIQLPNTTYTSGTVQFSNLNGLSFGSNGAGIVTGSYTVPAATVFSNSNNITFGLAGSTVTASAAAQTAQTQSNIQAISAGTTSANTGAIVFSNSNGLAFGLNGQTVTGSYTVPTQSNQSLGLVAIGNTTAQSSSTNMDARSVNLSGANGVSVGFSAGTLVISGATGGAGGGAAISAAGSSQNAGTIVFSNSNGVSFGMNGSTITASASGAGASASLLALGNTTAQSSSNTFALSAFNVSATGLVSAGMSGNTLVISGPGTTGLTQMSAGISGGNTAGNTGTVAQGQIVFAGGNNITLSGSTNGSSMTVTISGGAGGGGGSVNFSAGTTSNNLATLVFSNSNGVSFGLNGSTITASASGAGASATVLALGNTTAQSSSNTMPLSAFNVSAAGVISAGMSGNTLVLSSPGTTGLTQMSAGISGGNTSGNTGTVAQGQVVFAGGNNITLSGSTNASSMTITISAGAGGGAAQSLGVSTGGNTSGNTGIYSGQVVFAGGNNITLSVSSGAAGAQTITISGANAGGAQTGISGIVVSNTTYTSGTVSFSNANGISFGSSAGQAITASYTVPAVTQVSSVGLFALGNTTQNSSSTLDQRSLSFNALGAMTWGYSNGSIQVSAPATSSLSATGAVSISVNGSTISIGVVSTSPQTRFIWPNNNALTAVSAPGNASMSFQYVPIQENLTASRIDALVGWTGGSSATANTCAIALSVYAAIYTKNAATLSSLSSGSTQTTYSYASNTAGHTEFITGAIRPVSVPVNVNASPGEYFVGFNFVTATSSIGTATTNLGQTYSMFGGNNVQTAVNYAEIGSQTATSVGLFGAMGVYNAASTGLPASVSVGSIVQTGASLSQANIALVFRNN